MTKNYFQLTLVQRYQIEALKKVGLEQYEIAITLGVHKSTVSRELKRNVPKRGTGAKIYSVCIAQVKADIRHKIKPKQVLFTLALKDVILKKMTIEKWSSELISAQWKKEKKPGVSHETIYKFVWETKFGNKKRMRNFSPYISIQNIVKDVETVEITKIAVV